MHSAPSDRSDTVSDVAAGLTDLALKSLAGSRMLHDSVEVELKLWHTLEAELEQDRRWQRPIPRHGEAAPVGEVLQQAVSRAARRVADAMEPFSATQGRRAERADGYLCHA
jgi:hypothetical protein